MHDNNIVSHFLPYTWKTIWEKPTWLLEWLIPSFVNLNSMTVKEVWNYLTLSPVNPVLDYGMFCISDELTDKKGQIMRGVIPLKKQSLTTY